MRDPSTTLFRYHIGEYTPDPAELTPSTSSSGLRSRRKSSVPDPAFLDYLGDSHRDAKNSLDQENGLGAGDGDDSASRVPFCTNSLEYAEYHPPERRRMVGYASGQGGPGWQPERRRRTMALITMTVSCMVIGYLVVDWLLPSSPIAWTEVLGLDAQMPWRAGKEEGKAPITKSYLDKAVRIATDPNHILVPRELNTSPKLLRPLQTRPPLGLLESYYATGRPNHDTTTYPLVKPSVDVVYLWVNATDPCLHSSMLRRAEQEGLHVEDGDRKRYRDNGELRGSMRSAKSALRGLDTIHVLSGDYACTEDDLMLSAAGGNTSAPGDSWTVGQIPAWLDWEAVHNGSAGVKWHFHSNVFRIPVDENDTPEDLAWDADFEKEWRDFSTPSFNSFAIESRVGWIEGIAENLSVRSHPDTAVY